MAVDKKTLLREALKQVQAGKIDKATETYKAILKIDPRDASVHNTLGDLAIKQGKKKEAIAEYLEVAALYEKDGFALRAIAICQKVINLDSEQIAVRIKLGDLYSGQKLPAEGRAQYMLAANYYDKKGDVANALDIFRRIADLDPGNPSVRVKLAGMFEKQKFPEKAAEEYVRAAQGYAEKKEMNTAVQLYVRAFKLSPANTEARRRLADFYAQRQDWSVVVGLLETPVAKGSRDTDLLVLYAEALTRVNHPRDAAKVLEGALGREPNSVPLNLAFGRACLKAGDIEKGTGAFNRCVSVHLAEDRFELAESLLREMAESAPDDDKIFQRLLEVAQKRGEKASIAQAYLKLAAVYERKQLVRSATGAIEKYLEINPGDAAAIKRLEHLRALTPAPKVEAPPPPPPPPAVSPPPPVPPPLEEDDVVEINLLEDGLAATGGVGEEELTIEIEGEPIEAPTFEPTSVAEARAIIRQGAPEKASEFLEEHLGRNPGDVEAWQALIEARRQLGNSRSVRDGLLRLAAVHRGSAQFDEARAAYKGALDADPRSAAAVRGLADLLVEEEAVAAPPLVEEEAVAVPPLVEEEAVAAPPLVEEEAAAAPPLVEEEVAAAPPLVEEEAAAAPPLVEAVGSEEEIGVDLLDRAIGETAGEPEPALEEFAFDDFVEKAPDFGAQSAEPPPLATVAPGETVATAGTGAGEFEEFLAEADFYFQQGLIDEAEFLYSKLLCIYPGHPVLTMQLRKLEEMRAHQSPVVPAAADTVNLDEELPGAPGPDHGAGVSDFSDFLSELRQELEPQLVPDPLASPAPLPEDAGLAEIFQEFQRSVKEQLGDEDFETHYNLGIAYKEMGLMEEAVTEFTLAEKSPARRLDAVSMIALCLREMGRVDEAALRLRAGLTLAGEGSEGQKGFLYDLAALHQQAGRTTEAQELLRRLLALDPGYRDVAARVGAPPPATSSTPPATISAPSATTSPPRKKSKVSYL